MARLTFAILLVAAALLTRASVVEPARLSQRTPFWFFEPAVDLEADERKSIARGEPVVKILDAEGQELAVFAGGSLETTPETFIERVRDVVALRHGRHVLASARFSSPPQLSDLSRLTLGESDLEDLETCKPRDCGLKLGAEEIARLQRAAATSNVQRKRAAELELRRIVLDRVRTYLAEGFAALPAYEDKERPVHPDAIFSSLLEGSSLPRHAPAFAAYLARPSRTKPADVESFLYWAKEDFGQKPVITVAHVSILRGGEQPNLPAVVVVSKQIFASHYTNGVLAVSALDYDAASNPPAHLGYVYRVSIDALDGVLRRPIIEGRIENEAKPVIVEQLKRLQR